MRGEEAKNNGTPAPAGYPVPWPGVYPYGGFQQQEGTSFRDQLAGFLDIVVRRRLTFALVFGAVVAAVVLMTLAATPKFVASSWVLVETDSHTRSIEPFGSGLENAQFVRPQRSVEGEILILEISNNLATQVAEDLIELGAAPANRAKFTILETESSDGENSSSSASLATVGRRLGAYVNFEQESPEANIIRISATSSAAEEAALISNLYAREYVNLTREANRAHLSASREFLERQEEKWRSKLHEVEEAALSVGISVSEADAAGRLGERGAFLVDQVATMEAERDRTEIDIQIRRAGLDALERELSRANSQIVGTIATSAEREMEAVRNMIAELEIRKKEIEFRYPGVDASEIDSPELRAIESQITELRAALTELSRTYVADMDVAGGAAGADGLGYIASLRRRIADERIAIDGMEAKLQSVGRRLTSYVDQLGRLPSQSLQVARMERTRQHTAQMYESVVSRLQEILIAEQSETGYARVAREAAIPGSPSSPDMFQNLLLGLLVGFLLGGLGVVAVDKIDNRLYRPEDVEDAGLSLIGLVPDMRTLLENEFDGSKVFEIEGKQVATTLVGLSEPSSAIAEAYRFLRTSVMYSARSAHVRRVLVTSSNMGEGKSVTAANLAIAMANAGRRTILIDGDLRRPQVHKLFGFATYPGLTDLLGASHVGHIESYVQPSSVAGLAILTAGSFIDDPLPLLSSKRLERVLNSLSESFDYVVVDSPPIRAANDAVFLSTQCDGTLLVARAGVTRGPELDLARKLLLDVDAEILGVLFNAFDVSMSFGYAYKYSNYSDYTTYSTYVYTDSKAS